MKKSSVLSQKNRRYDLFQSFTVWILLVLVRFLPFLMGRTLFFGDNYSLMVPGKLFTAIWIRQGILPLWNPHIFGGLSWIGDINQSVLYPTSFLFAVLNPAQALNVTILLHVGIAFWGMYFLAHGIFDKHQYGHYGSILAGVLFAFSSQVTGAINNLSTIQAIVWLPVVIWVGLRLNKGVRYVVLFAGVVFLQLAAGYPQHVLFSIVTAVLFSWWFWIQGQKKSAHLRSIIPSFRWWFRWIIAAVASILISAVIWFPFVETLLHSTRSIQSTAQSLAGSLHPAELIKFVVPYFFDHAAGGIKWGPAWDRIPNIGLYIPWIGIILIVISLMGMNGFKKIVNKKIRAAIWFFAVICGLSVLFAFGQYIPGFRFVQILFPLLKVVRGPSLILIVPSLVVALWISQVLILFLAQKKLVFSQRTIKILLLFLAVSAIMIFIAWVSIDIWFEHLWRTIDDLMSGAVSASRFHTVEKDNVIVKNILNNVWVNLVFLTAALTSLRFRKATVLIILIGLEMIYNTQGMLIFAPTKVYPTWEQIKQVRTDSFWKDRISPEIPSFQYRFLIRNSNAPYTGFNAYWEALTVRKPFSDSYVDSGELRNFSHLIRMRDGATPDWNMVLGISSFNGYTTLLPQNINSQFSFQEVAINNLPPIDWQHELLDDWAVKYYLVDTWFPLYQDEKLPNVNSEKQVSMQMEQQIVEKDVWRIHQLEALPRLRYQDGAAVKVEEFDQTPNVIQFGFDNQQQESYIILADRYDPGWWAKVNGKKKEVSAVDTFWLIPVDPGHNEIKLIYSPRLFYYGMVVSGITLFILLVLISFSRNIDTYLQHIN